MSIKDLSFADLELVASLSEVKSVRALGREIKQSPAQISKSIRRIEAEAGTALFQRTSSGMILTPEGAVFRNHAKTVLSQLAPFTTLKGTCPTKYKTLTIGSTSLLNVALLPQVIGALSSQHPHLRFRCVDVAPEQIVTLGTQGTIDLAVTLSSYNWTSSWTSIRSGDLVLGLFGRKGHPLGAQTTPEKVKTYPFLFPIYLGQSTIRFGDDQCPLPRTQRILGHQTSTASAAIHIAENSDHLIYAPKLAMRDGILSEIKVEGWSSVRKKIYVSANIDVVPQIVLNDWTRAMEEAIDK